MYNLEEEREREKKQQRTQIQHFRINEFIMTTQTKVEVQPNTEFELVKMKATSLSYENTENAFYFR